jgi:hypothetical protein
LPNHFIIFIASLKINPQLNASIKKTMKTTTQKICSYFMLLLILSITGCGPVHQNPVKTLLTGAFLPLTAAEAILKGRPNEIVDNYNSMTGQCSGNVNYDAPECQRIRQQAELSRIQAMSLPQLESFYEQYAKDGSKAQSPEAVSLVKSRLIEENTKLGTFQGYFRAAEISGNPRYVTEHTNLVRTTEEQKLLEQFNLLRVTDLDELFDVDFQPKVGEQKAEHYTPFWGLTVSHGDNVKQDISGVLRISKKRTNKLSLGHYRLTVKITLHQPTRFIRESRIKGNADKNIDYAESTTVTANVSPPDMSANVNVNFSVTVGKTIRGSMGGMDKYEPLGEPSFEVEIVKAEVI